MDGSSKMNGQHPVWKATALPEEYENRSAWCAELHAVFLAAMVEQNNIKSPSEWVFTDSWAVANGQSYGQAGW